MRGLFVTFEGVEGAGKTTQIALLRAHLEEHGHTVLTTREPGGSDVGEAIRDILLNHKGAPVPRAEMLLFLASRAHITDTVIRPALDRGTVVICDRFIDSTAAYQGHARGLDLDAIYRLNEFATGGLLPEITFLLDLDPAHGLGRQKDRNRMEAEPLAFHTRVREGFLTEAARSPERFHVIDASCTVGEIQQNILAAISPLVRQVSQ